MFYRWSAEKISDAVDRGDKRPMAALDATMSKAAGAMVAALPDGEVQAMVSTVGKGREAMVSTVGKGRAASCCSVRIGGAHLAALCPAPQRIVRPSKTKHKLTHANTLLLAAHCPSVSHHPTAR
jgi:fructose-1,6-bisphosphatase/sedoheptulose 1,7-bisphosphatase-like protein